MGYKIAEAASGRGHIVTLISGPTKLSPPKVKKFISIDTADDLLKALKRELKGADCLVMCAAVGDFRPRRVLGKKIKRKKRLVLELVPNKDLLKELSGAKKGRLFVGFSLETEDLVKSSVKKLKNKNLDLIAANRLTKSHNPFGSNKLNIVLIDKSGHRIYINNKSKAYIAQVLLDKVENLWYLRNNRGTTRKPRWRAN